MSGVLTYGDAVNLDLAEYLTRIQSKLWKARFVLRQLIRLKIDGRNEPSKRTPRRNTENS